METLTGSVFGYWTVLDRHEKNENGGYRWLCRCKCGTEKMILARNLKNGSSKSCGCMRREQQRKKDLTGQTFGELTVLSPADGHDDRWLCRCGACGKGCSVPQRTLLSGKKLHCGCRTKRDHTRQDITGTRFRMLTAIAPTERRDYKGSVIWRCRCDCGNEVEVSYSTLKHGTLTSCGCGRDRAGKNLKNYLTHVAGTSVDMLKSSKKRRPNSTGVKGVYLIRGKYRAEICFQQHTYYLGTYSSLELAAAVRKEAEKVLHQEFIAFYERWKARADSDPEWGDNNPILVRVKHYGHDDFQVVMLPDI